MFARVARAGAGVVGARVQLSAAASRSSRSAATAALLAPPWAGALALAGRGVAGAALLAGGAYFAVDAYLTRTYGEAATLARSLESYRVVVPAFLQYRATEFAYETLPAALGRPADAAAAAAAYEALHRRWAPEVLAVFLRLRGFYIKTGQLIANNVGDGAPETWRRAFEPLLDAVPPKDFAAVRATVEEGLGCRLEDAFASFDPEPLASASIGQVHRAVTRRGARDVVVKVMYPEVEKQFRGDIATARAFLEVALPVHVPALREIEKQFANEFDYTREADQLARVRANLIAAGYGDRVIVPEPVRELTSKAVLTMTRVPHATKLGAALDADAAIFAGLRGVSVAALRAEEEAADAAALREGRLRDGARADELDALIRARRWRNFLLRPLGGRPLPVPLNHARLVDLLLDVHGHEVLVDGVFNGDPHPGNILLSAPPGREPTLALVDYGCVKELAAVDRLRLARVIVALARADAASPADRAAVARAVRELGLRTAANKPDTQFKIAAVYFDRDDKLATGGMHVQQYIDALEAEDRVTRISDDMVLAVRAGLMLRGLGHALGQHRSLAKAWRPHAERVMREAGEDPGAPIETFYRGPEAL